VKDVTYDKMTNRTKRKGKEQKKKKRKPGNGAKEKET
jgi:hypothetical protein